MQKDFATRYPPVRHDPNAKPPPVPWLVEGLWLRGKINGIFGPEKSGKSRFICWILAQMLGQQEGGPVLYRDGNPMPIMHHRSFRKVLYLNAEEREVDVQARINAYARYLCLEPREDWPITYVNAAGMHLEQQRERSALEDAYLRSKEYDILVVDPLRRVHTGNENDNSAMAPLHNDLRRWSNQYDLTELLVHHTGHLRDDADLERFATWSRGATDLATLLDAATMMRTLSAEDGRTVREIRRAGRFPIQPNGKLMDYGDPDGFRYSASA
jgi:regulatory protein RepA